MNSYQIWFRGPLADVINCADFFVDRFRCIHFVGAEVEICLFPEELKFAVNTELPFRL